jgi:hypothetical protein
VGWAIIIVLFGLFVNRSKTVKKKIGEKEKSGEKER